MLNVHFPKKDLKLLLLGAHCDDIEMGCGGTLLKLREEYSITEVFWIVFCSSKMRAEEALKCANIFLKDIPRREIIVNDFRDGYLPYDEPDKVKDYFESIKLQCDPDIIFTHYRRDRHQDHRFISDLTWNTYRNHLIMEYEIPKYDGDFGMPNFFVQISEDILDKKIRYILDSYSSQTNKHWFKAETFRSYSLLRAMESANTQKYCEAFYSRKILF